MVLPEPFGHLLDLLGPLPSFARRTVAVALILLIPPIATVLVALALCGVGIVVFYGALMHVPTFHAEPIWTVIGLCLGTAAGLHRLWYRLTGHHLT